MSDSQYADASVSKVSQYGFQLEGYGDKWFNWDKKYTTHPVPKFGDHVEVEYTEWQGKRYVKEMTITSGQTSAPSSSVRIEQAPSSMIPRDTLIVRQSSMDRAVEFCRPYYPGNLEKADDHLQMVKRIAEEIEKWVQRE
jgi:hypothetical protein